MKRLSFMIGIILILALTAFGAERPLYLNASAIPEQRTEDLLARMTLREKLGQVTQIEIHRLMEGFWSKGPLDESWLKRVLVDYSVGSILSGGDGAPEKNSPKAWVEMTNEVQRWAMKSRLKVPILYGVDAVHGHNNVIGATIYPHNLGLAASFNTELIEAYTATTADELAATGVHWTFAPVLDVAVDPRWGRTHETLGEDPYLVSILGVSQIKGFERSGRVMACGKHFTGYSAPQNGHDRHPAKISKRELYETHIMPYRAAVLSGMGSVMVNSGAVNGVPVHASKALLTDTLRNELGFRGLIVSDWEDVGKLVTYHRYASSMEEALTKAYNAGLDLNMVPMDVDVIDILEKLVKQGKISQTRIDDAVRHVLLVKFRLGLFEHPLVDAQKAAKIVGSRKSRQLARQLAQQSMVLLRNEKALLPLNKEVKTIFVTGPSANSLQRLCGGWSIHWQGAQDDELYGMTVLEAIKKKVPSAKVKYLVNADRRGRFIDAARKAEKVVVVVGEKSYAEGQGDSPELALERSEEKIIRTLQKEKIPFVLVVAAGRPLILPGGSKAAPAILWAFLPGTEGGPAIADILFGDANPSGRLPITLPKQAKQVPMTYRVTGEKSYDPMYPFGAGLSYTRFKYSGLSVSPQVKFGQNALVTMEVKNVGERAGDDVVLLFLCDDVSSVPVPKRQLQGFARVSLKPGETKKVCFTVTPEQLGLWNKNFQWVQEKGSYTIMVGDQRARFELVD